jgi:hypothetical protein
VEKFIDEVETEKSEKGFGGETKNKTGDNLNIWKSLKSCNF